MRGAIERLLASALRAGRMIHRVRRFVKLQDPFHESFDANDAVREVSEILVDESARRGVALNTRLAFDLPCLLGDTVQVQQVLVNLTRNAIDAVIAMQPLNPLIVMEMNRTETGAVEILVSDNGERISEERLTHIFDPFFSTRAEGMGIVLALCRRIVLSQEATIGVESMPGVRTTFRLTFPTIGDQADAEPDGLSR